ncbi:Hsp20/alpha crystallin family protein [Oscillatoria sp. FACHB-1406]|uniref:Hsp20/alpha crystallin family protein n=1 Tax=Oscillatoria sp. FACHB-1406 TaxID=2692846 RepID=UPI001688277D|nr:Hsp20/alpha crystallin family protein [Oscillatoria sp. FACHB-1406]MBD2578221.1 Hsp20/alpha crystallin family protein [Oscillatoria sp. FACHB-1406]
MAIVRWNPFSDFEIMRRQMDSVFDEMLGFNGESQVAWKPAIELQDTGDSLLLRVGIPGMEAKDLDIRVSRTAVSLRGEHESKKSEERESGTVHSEFYYGKFERAIALPVPVQNDNVTADYTNGILTLTLPKAEEPKDRVVKIDLGAKTQPQLDSENKAE